MRSPNRWLVALFIITLVAGRAFPAAANSGQVLVLVQSDDQAALDLLAENDAPVHHQSQWRVIALVDARQLAEPGLRAAAILDRTPWEGGEAYYWAYHPGRKDARPEGAGKVETLFRDGNTLLVRAAPEEAERLPLQGWEIARIPQTSFPLRTAGPAESTPAPTPQFGGLFDEMVSQMSTASYAATLQSLVDFGTRYTYSDEIEDAADWIYDQMAGFGLAVERHQFTISSLTRENIIATIHGQVYPDEVLFIIGHYDSISDDPYNSAPGADDNASGTAAVIETARVLSGYSFERTIVFACFAGEEQGLVGSFAYTGDIAGAGMNVVGCINFDMIAYSGSDPAPPDLIIYTNTDSMSVAEQLRDAALHYFADDLEPVVINDGGMSASDHAAFWSRGYPAIFGIEAEPWTADFNPLYHTVNDLPDILDMDYAANVTRAGLAAHIRGWNFDGTALTEISGINFFAWPAEELRYGARVDASSDLDSDGLNDLVVAAGPDPSAGTPVRVYGFPGGMTELMFTLDAFDSEITHGSSVAAGRF